MEKCIEIITIIGQEIKIRNIILIKIDNIINMTNKIKLYFLSLLILPLILIGNNLELEAKQCKGTTKKNVRCKNKTLHDSQLCHYHRSI